MRGRRSSASRTPSRLPFQPSPGSATRGSAAVATGSRGRRREADLIGPEDLARVGCHARLAGGKRHRTAATEPQGASRLERRDLAGDPCWNPRHSDRAAAAVEAAARHWPPARRRHSPPPPRSPRSEAAARARGPGAWQARSGGSCARPALWELDGAVWAHRGRDHRALDQPGGQTPALSRARRWMRPPAPGRGLRAPPGPAPAAAARAALRSRRLPLDPGGPLARQPVPDPRAGRVAVERRRRPVRRHALEAAGAAHPRRRGRAVAREAVERVVRCAPGRRSPIRSARTCAPPAASRGGRYPARGPRRRAGCAPAATPTSWPARYGKSAVVRSNSTSIAVRDRSAPRAARAASIGSRSVSRTSSPASSSSSMPPPPRPRSRPTHLAMRMRSSRSGRPLSSISFQPRSTSTAPLPAAVLGHLHGRGDPPGVRVREQPERPSCERAAEAQLDPALVRSRGSCPRARTCRDRRPRRRTAGARGRSPGPPGSAIRSLAGRCRARAFAGRSTRYRTARTSVSRARSRPRARAWGRSAVAGAREFTTRRRFESVRTSVPPRSSSPRSSAGARSPA